jgi:hypothetical protein
MWNWDWRGNFMELGKINLKIFAFKLIRIESNSDVHTSQNCSYIKKCTQFICPKTKTPRKFSFTRRIFSCGPDGGLVTYTNLS